MDTKNYILKDQKTEKNLCFLKVKNDEMSSCINPSNYGCQSIFRRKFFNVHPFDGIFFHYFFQAILQTIIICHTQETLEP
jgi:hypothetical protein